MPRCVTELIERDRLRMGASFNREVDHDKCLSDGMSSMIFSLRFCLLCFFDMLFL